MHLMKLSHLSLLVLLAGPMLALSPSQASAPYVRPPATEARPAASVEGRVVKDAGGEPVKKALIELIAENQNEGGNYTTITSADGSFRIEGVANGISRSGETPLAR
jgi:hypothetical protein